MIKALEESYKNDNAPKQQESINLFDPTICTKEHYNYYVQKIFKHFFLQ